MRHYLVKKGFSIVQLFSYDNPFCSRVFCQFKVTFGPFSTGFNQDFQKSQIFAENCVSAFCDFVYFYSFPHQNSVRGGGVGGATFNFCPILFNS